MRNFREEAPWGGRLYKKLTEYGSSDYYGFHMPGHKRNLGYFQNPFQWDITEIDGFDDLHHPEKDGILVQAQNRAASLYGSEETHFLVNGSTAGILAAMAACTRRGGKILVSRNCHKSVYHGIALLSLQAGYVYPQTEENFGINGSILPRDVDNYLEKQPDTEAVLIVSPTYEGICSDVRQIAEVVHQRGIPLIVDQAHGAHFPFHSGFPEDAVSQGADLVVHSVHKTLPAPTQTALLHVNGSLTDRQRLRMYLSMFQTSSPSYVLMAGIDACMEFLERDGAHAFAAQLSLLENFYRDCRKLQKLRIMDRSIVDGRTIWDADPSRLLCHCGKAALNGRELGELLRIRYHLQMEMCTCTYALGITSAADSKEGFARLARALQEIDRTVEAAERGAEPSIGEAVLPVQQRFSIGEALDAEKYLLPVGEVLGKAAGRFIYLYPPGIPLLAPGEVFTEEMAERLTMWQQAGMDVQGIEQDGRVCVIAER